MSSAYSTQVNQTNLHTLLEHSSSRPLLFYFWAPSQPESVTLMNQLEPLVAQYQGAFQLALLNCQEEYAIATQFGVQVLPTLALFINGQAVDGLAGAQPIEAIKALLDQHLPSQSEQDWQQARQLIQQGQAASALPLLLSLDDAWRTKPEVRLALAQAYLANQDFISAKTELMSIPEVYHNPEYKTLMAQVELYEQAADSPEIQALETELAQNPEDAHLAIELASQYHLVQRSEEALALLWPLLARDLNAQEGEVKKIFMDIINALGQGNALASRYRRQLYSLLY